MCDTAALNGQSIHSTLIYAEKFKDDITMKKYCLHQILLQKDIMYQEIYDWIGECNVTLNLSVEYIQSELDQGFHVKRHERSYLASDMIPLSLDMLNFGNQTGHCSFI